MVDSSFFEKCAFVSIDIQAGERQPPLTADRLPKDWIANGFSVEDVNAANDYYHLVCAPNAVRVAEACRRRGTPMIFVHWGFLFEDGMDLDPPIRRLMVREHGLEFSKWSGHISQPSSRPAREFAVRKVDYVIPKSGQDAFTSSNIEFVLRNLGVENLVFVGGHTGACLGKSAATAKKRGFRILCVEDATCDARESARLPNLRATGFDYVVTTEEILALIG